MMKKKSMKPTQKPMAIQTSDGSYGQEKETEDYYSDNDDEDLVDHTAILQIGYIKIQYQKLDLIKQVLERTSQSFLDLSISPTSIYYIGSTNFISEDTPYQKFLLVFETEASSFLVDELCPNKNLQENLKIYLEQIDHLLPKFALKRIAKLLTEKSLNLIKDKVKQSISDINKQLKKQGQQIPSYSKTDDESCLFKAAMGKYIKGKLVHPLI